MVVSGQAGLAREKGAKVSESSRDPTLPLFEPLRLEERGDERNARGDFAAAEEFFARAADRALRIAESGAESAGNVHLLRARLLHKSGRTSEAAAACQDAIACGINSPSDLDAAAEILFVTLRAHQSPFIRGGVAVHPASDGDILELCGADQPALDLCLSIAYCDEALLGTRSVSRAYRVNSHMREGHVRLMRGDPQKACVHFTSAVQQCRVLLAHDDEDIAALRSLVHAYRGRAASHLILTGGKRIRGELRVPDSYAAEYAAAATACAILIRVAGETPERAWNLADCLEKAGRKEEAKAWYARSCAGNK